MNSSQSLPHDFVYSHIQKYLREKCHLALFDDNMDIKRELDDIADTTGVEAVREYCELFTNISEAYGDGTPQAVVAELCLEALKSFELQYIMPEEMKTLIRKFAKRKIDEDKYNDFEEWKKQRSILLKRKEELEKEVNELKEELKDSIELCQPERIETTRDLKEIPQQIINPGDGDTVLTFDLGSLTDEKFRLIKNHILTMD
ncbi:Uncharacterized protein QTN25_000743 [Entamoeba marina]